MLDPELLNACTAKADRLLDLERATDQAKADYHYAIRRLHLHGGSYREIAAALGLSHQRVSQIVTADSRNWLRRWIMPTTEQRRLACSFCERSSRKVAKLVAGPQVYICDECIDAIENVFKTGDAAKKPMTLSLVADNKTRCSFCLRRRNKGLRLAGTARERICSECITMAREMAKQDVR